MPLLPYALARPFLFTLEPETAHELALDLLARGASTPLQWLWCGAPVQDPVTLAGLALPNRVGLAAGIDKNGRAIDAFAAMGFGFAEVGTVTPRPQPGNPKPRLFRLPERQALINRMGFNNAGLDALIRNVQRSRWWRQRNDAGNDAGRMKLGINIGKNADTPIERAADDYLAALAGVYPLADYVTLNISSPNTRNLRSLQAGEALDPLLAAVSARRVELAAQHGRRVPLFLKIAPDLDAAQIGDIAQALTRHGMDGVIATNTTLAREAVQGLPHGQEAGGLSGAPVREMSNRVIAGLRAALPPDFPIIGVGGILTGADAAEKLRAGANAVQLCTGFIYQGPALVREAALALAQSASAPAST
ncbi:MAG: quinone-dependent dihydroorotate dehydrogenase [Burkholderiaceae bacterium]|jgi:dihydroorotate dehydrogenase|nr:quinone-dependent dihydroorotate dehydrogenase [Burkholderiaceae bacterium]